jgi:hypothetical protein
VLMALNPAAVVSSKPAAVRLWVHRKRPTSSGVQRSGVKRKTGSAAGGKRIAR